MSENIQETKTAASFIMGVNPATGENLGSIRIASVGDVERARADMRQASTVWSVRPIQERIDILRKFHAAMVDALDEITLVVNKDTGKSRQNALIEVFLVADNLGTMLKNAKKWLGRERIPSGLYPTKICYTEQRAFGTVAVISPWNYPFLLSLQPVLTALLAGNTVMLKPSEVTPMVGKLIETLFNRVPELAPYVRVLHGDGSVGAALVESQPDLIYLTGSTATARKVARAAAEHLIPTIFELGGKDAMIVLDDANLEAAARWAAWGACANAGQTCIAVERLIVVESVYDRFVDLLCKEASKLTFGYSDLKKDMHDYGPMSSERQVQIVTDQIEDAVKHGATLAYGGERDRLFIQPTVLTGVNSAMQVWHEETFGPLMPVMKVADEATAVRMANDSDYGLSAYVWGGVVNSLRVLRKLDAGTLVANDVVAQFAMAQLPFGGVKQSGTGRSHGREDLLQFSNTHSYVVSVPPLKLDISTKLREPGNYRLAEAVLKATVGANLLQRLESAEVVYNSYKVQEMLKEAGELFGRIADKINSKRG